MRRNTEAVLPGVAVEAFYLVKKAMFLNELSKSRTAYRAILFTKITFYKIHLEKFLT
jgi:hypothetical protein